MRLCLALAAILAGVVPAGAAPSDDFIAEAFPVCGSLRDAMQVECWTPLVTLWERGDDAAENSALANRCEVLYEAALVACPNWPRTPRTEGWRAWYRRVQRWGLPPDKDNPLDALPGCLREPSRGHGRSDCG
jgi:hypothetical protein